MTTIDQPKGMPERLKPDSIKILGVPVHLVTTAGAVELVSHFMDEPGLHQIATVNPEFVMKAQEDSAFMAILQQAELCIADGVGLLIAGRWQGRPIPERVAGSDLVYLLAEQAALQGWRLFLLGAAPGVAEEAAGRLEELYTGLTIAGTYAGSPDPAENEEIVELINTSQAELLYVAYGAPGQDKWIARNRQQLPTVRVAMGIGGSLDFISGRAARAPSWLQRLGLEWLYRLFKEPRRWRRMLALPRFVFRIVREGSS
jgi:N-acetylglucosaminyldiphosphoundecaprenol N-acetyl-beta-D-mannosaminyltransferase